MHNLHGKPWCHLTLTLGTTFRPTTSIYPLKHPFLMYSNTQFSSPLSSILSFPPLFVLLPFSFPLSPPFPSSFPLFPPLLSSSLSSFFSSDMEFAETISYEKRQRVIDREKLTAQMRMAVARTRGEGVGIQKKVTFTRYTSINPVNNF